MAAIISWQFSGWPASWSTLAAASRALSFLSLGAASSALGAASFVFGVVFSVLGVLGVLIFPGFLAAGVTVPFAWLLATRRVGLVPAASGTEASGTAASGTGVAGTAGWPTTKE